ncbi:hypothetical protein [Variovorax soli]|uniref:Uncharacterized protein n=1 Tax=Variovorax soli TaxID=376815 RepID=A0ABU1NMP2_9BURK|nr:hypothetical protein [Variovorax soli]MDR6539689.1 hypothetical protein [Variovorax soli]
MKIEYELAVDEAIKGHFYWVISTGGATGNARSVVDFAHGPLPTRKAAEDAGSVALRWHQRASTGASAVFSGLRTDWYAETVPAELR